MRSLPRLVVLGAVLVVVVVTAAFALAGRDDTAADLAGSTADGPAAPIPVQPGSGGPFDPGAPVAPPSGVDTQVQPLAVYDPVAIHDPMINNVRAVSFLVPHGWQVQGGIHWEPNLHPLAGAVLQVSDPSGAFALETYFPPRYSWISDPSFQNPGMNWLGAIMAPPRSAQDALQQLVLPHVRPQGQVVSAVPIDTSHLQGQLEGIRLRVAHDGPGGSVHEDFVAIVDYFSGNQGGVTMTQWGFTMLYSVRAPAGQLDAALPTLDTIIASFDLDPLWFSNYLTVMDMFMQRGYEGIRLAGELSRTFTETYNEINRIHMETWENQQATYDRMFENFGDYIRDTQRVRTSSGGVSRTSRGVACELRDGTILVLPDGATCPPDSTRLSLVQ